MEITEHCRKKRENFFKLGLTPGDIIVLSIEKYFQNYSAVDADNNKIVYDFGSSPTLVCVYLGTSSDDGMYYVDIDLLAPNGKIIVESAFFVAAWITHIEKGDCLNVEKKQTLL